MARPARAWASAAEHYQRFGLSRFFVAPSIAAERRITEYFVDGEAMAEYQVQKVHRGRGCRRAAERGHRAACRLHLRTRRSRARNRLGNSPGVWRAGAPHAHSASPRHPDKPVCAGQRPAGRHRVLVLGSQSDSGGRLQPARGPRVAVLYRAQQGSCVRAVRRRDLVWHDSAGSLQVHARRTVPAVRLRERRVSRGPLSSWRCRLHATVSAGSRTSSAAGCMRRWCSMRDRPSTRGMRHRDAPALASDSPWTR